MRVDQLLGLHEPELFEKRGAIFGGSGHRNPTLEHDAHHFGVVVGVSQKLDVFENGVAWFGGAQDLPVMLERARRVAALGGDFGHPEQRGDAPVAFV